MTPGTCPVCGNDVARLSAELAKEIRNTLIMEAVIVSQQQRIDALEAEVGHALIAQVEEYLTEPDGGS